MKTFLIIASIILAFFLYIKLGILAVFILFAIALVVRASWRKQ